MDCFWAHRHPSTMRIAFREGLGHISLITTA
jgi:hypothetical protein